MGSYAIADDAFYARALGGWGKYDRGTSGAFSHGAGVGYNLNQNWGAGLFYHSTPWDIVRDGIKIYENRTRAFGLEGDYYFSDSIKGARLGLKIGWASASFSAAVPSIPSGSLESDSYGNVTVGFTAGYEISLTDSLCAGIEGDYFGGFQGYGLQFFGLAGSVGLKF